MAEDHFVAEIIDPDTGAVLPEGSVGELVLTSLSKQAFPMIRYRTRDITRLHYDTCDCGRTLARMDAASRIADVARTVMAGQPVNAAKFEGGADVS